MHLRRATSEDIATIGSWFDERVAWLVERGITRQWGTTPISDRESFMARVRGWVESDETFLVEGLGLAVLSHEPTSYAAEGWQPGSVYVGALITRPLPEAKGLGRRLMLAAESWAWDQHCPAIRLDCWADSPVLPNYYAGLGYAWIGEFNLDGWRGAVMEKAAQNESASVP